MAIYKQPCIQCGEFIERDSRLCPRCATRTPFGYHCPNCQREIERGYAVCSACGKPLMTTCPFCEQQTFIGSEKCDACGESLMIMCENKRCGLPQWFENTKCTCCGKAIKKAKQQIEKRKK